MKTEKAKVFFYDHLCDTDEQIQQFGQSFEFIGYIDYITSWRLITMKINDRDRRVLIKGKENDDMAGVVYYVDNEMIVELDKYYGKEFTKIKVVTMLDSDSFLYVKRVDNIKKVI